MRRFRGLGAAALCCALVGLLGCGQLASPKLDNPLENSTLPVPSALRASVSDQQVNLAWSMTSEAGVTGYRIFRRLAGEPSFQIAGDVATKTYADASLQNGRSYEYAVSALGARQALGRRSPIVAATPNLFAMILNDGAAKSRSDVVSVGLSYPAGTAYMMLGNDAAFTNGSWETVRSPRNWTLAAGTGTKSVYAKFRDAQGSESQPVSDAIELDGTAQISSLVMNVPRPLGVGSVVHLSMDVSETEGRAEVHFGAELAGVELRDDGRLGDPTPNDGRFERDLIVEATMTVLGQPATGDYVDGAGNVAPEFTTSDSLTIAFFPQTTTLSNVQSGGRSKLTLQWLETSEPNFAAYRVYRSPDAAVDSLDDLVAEVRNRTSLQFTDVGLVEGQTYYYRVFVRSTNRLESGSNTRSALVADLSPPQPVLYTPTNVGTTTLTVRWDPTPITDFLRYRLYRSSTPGVSDRNGVLVYQGTVPDATFYDDYNLTTGTTYYYVLYVDDQGMKTNKSLEIVTTTR